jgi:3',5'-cyclic-AMP phosphodiesterase
MQIQKINRRDFIGISTVLCIPSLAKANVSKLKEPLRLGLISDLHHDLIHDGKNRLMAFLAHNRAAKTDGIIQMGDFAFPNKTNRDVIDLFNRSHKTSLHVLGNHDTDAGHTKQQCLDYWGMPARYYARKVKGIWLVVLDANDNDSPDHKGGYPAYINPEQVAWLKARLDEITEPIIVISHQPLIGASAIDNAAEIQTLLASAADRVILALNGHTHVDSLIYAGGIPYLTINSASYFWIGDKFIHESYPKEIHQAHKLMSRMCPYQEPLYALMSIDPVTLTIQIAGKQTHWVGKSPAALGFKDEHKRWQVDQEITPSIRTRTVKRQKD